MSRMADDYYELLGVDDDAPVGDIRAAYRDKKAAVAGKDTDAAKAEAAALNKAWNVLSDPYQRGRYDQSRSEGNGDGVDDDEDDDETPVPARRAKRAAPDRSSSARNARAPLQPTIALPAGTEFPAVRRRLVAMGIDVLVLIVLFFVTSVVILPKVEKANHRKVYDAAVELTNHKIPDADKAVSNAKSAKSKADTNATNLEKQKGVNAPDAKAARAAADAADKKYTAAQATQKSLNDELTKHDKVLAPIQHVVYGIFFLVALVILVAPSAFGGQTIGKRSQGIRVIRVDGSPARVGDALRRYGVLVVVAFLLSSLLGPVGALVVVFIATFWTRNPNQQALHDRFAKTLVVADAV